jgi:hypothetical protein
VKEKRVLIANKLMKNVVDLDESNLDNFMNDRELCKKPYPCLASIDSSIMKNSTYVMKYRVYDDDPVYTVYGWSRKLNGYNFLLRDNYTILNTNYVSPYTVHIGNVSTVVDKLLRCWYPEKYYGVSIDNKSCIRFSSSIIRHGLSDDTEIEVDIYRIDNKYHDAVIFREGNNQIFVSNIARYREDAVNDYMNREIPPDYLNIMSASNLIFTYLLIEIMMVLMRGGRVALYIADKN